MSLYCIGKLKLKGERTIRFVFPSCVAVRRGLDNADIEGIDSATGFRGAEVYFSICDDPSSHDATALWLEAMSKPPDKVVESNLGNAVYSLLFNPAVSFGAIAFIDGGIQTVLEGTRQQCWTWFVERIGKPWDIIDNPILIWGRFGTA